MSEREVMEYDVVVVGAGPAGLATAVRLKQLNEELNVCVIEKASQVGAQILSGAVIEPDALDELLPGWRENPPPLCIPVVKDEFFLMSKTGQRKFLLNPPQLDNHGNFIVSLGALCAWLAPQAEALGVDIFPGYAAAGVHYRDDGSVGGVIIGDLGVGRDGEPKDSYTQGIEIHAQITVLAEGCRGHLSKQLIQHFQLDSDSDPQTYGIGIKELWRVPAGRVQTGLVQHGFGWPLDPRTYGGFFIYHLDKDRVAVGYVVGLDYEDPQFSPFEAFQQFKNHPLVKNLLADGEILSSGARALVEGGYQSLPKLEMPGALLVGDAAGLLNVPKIKGTHQAIRSGMLAAEHLVERLGQGALDSQGYNARLRASPIMAELRKVRNFRPGFQKGLWWGLLNSAWETVSAGRSPWTLNNHADHSALKRADTITLERDWGDRELPPRDRLAGVYFAATEHDEDQPVHLKILEPDVCISRCGDEYDHPCTRFCPAAVYEIVQDEQGKRLQINAANCVHCKTCDIKDPYQIINWTTPEGGAGPNYQNL